MTNVQVQDERISEENGNTKAFSLATIFIDEHPAKDILRGAKDLVTTEPIALIRDILLYNTALNFSNFIADELLLQAIIISQNTNDFYREIDGLENLVVVRYANNPGGAAQV